MTTATLTAPTTAPPHLMSVDEFWDFCQLPENQGHSYELIRGEVVEMPNPTRKHGRACMKIGFELETYALRVGRGYVVSNDSGVILFDDPATVVGPDVAYFEDAATFAEIHPKWGTNVPILAVEVLSPSDRRRVVMEKISNYLVSGVSAVWLADYEERFVTVFRSTGVPKNFGDTGLLIGDDYLPGFSCEVAALFRLPGEPLAAAAS